MKHVPLLVILLMICSVASAATVDLTPLEFYETNSQELNLTVNNFLGDDVINYVSIILPGLEVLEAAEYLGWDTSLNGTLVEWEEGSLETNSQRSAPEAWISYIVAIPADR